MDANLEAIDNLKLNLSENGFDLAKLPYVLQFNKRDLPTAMPVDQMTRDLRIKGEPIFEAVAPKGTGVFDTLKAAVKQVLIDLKSR
jgi:hypothetical protein